MLRRSLVVSDSLLDHLARIGYFKDITHDIKQRKSNVDRVAQVLDILNKVSDDETSAILSNFLATLRRDGQEHVANIFSQQSDARPMSDEHYQLLTYRKKEICTFLDPLNGVLGQLVSCGVFTNRDSSQVRAQRGLDEMARETIDILSRKADSAFDLFITALHNTGRKRTTAVRNTTNNSLSCGQVFS